MDKIYTSSICGPCKTLKKSLESKGLLDTVTFISIDDMDRSEYPKNLRAVPTLITEDGTTIVGAAIESYVILKGGE
jgi:predicted thioredoxin/glutaredoxin